MTKARTLADNFAADINGITASAPLTGGGTSGTVTVGIQDGTTSQKGAVQLEDSTASTSTTKASTPNSVKSAYDLANGAIAKSTIDAKGDLLVGTANDTVSRLAVASTAGYVLTVDSAEATGVKWAAATSTTFPTFSAYSNADQSQTANVWTKKNFEVEEWDTANNFASSRFTPTTAGYYQVSSGLYANDTGTLGLAFYKNGSEWKGQSWASDKSNYRCQLTALIYLNGSSDYVEVFSRSSSGNLYNGAGSVWFQGIGIRA